MVMRWHYARMGLVAAALVGISLMRCVNTKKPDFGISTYLNYF